MQWKTRITPTFLLFFVALFASNDQQQISVEQILERHVQAIGGREKVEAVHSVVTRGEYREGTFVIPDAYIARMRPYFKTICEPADKLPDVCEGYDGSAWEWYADPGVVLRTVGAAAAATRHGVELIDSLVDYKSRGTRIELVDTESFGNNEAYKLHVILADGFEKDVFVGDQSFLIVGERRSAQIHAFGEPVRSENRIGDYRAVDGVLFPFLVTEVEISTGKELNRFTTQSVTTNGKFSPEYFAPPKHSSSAFQQFLEHLYLERTDPVSVMWSYREFRAANPDLDTRKGVEFIGYQMSKMGDYNAAIDLLTANAADYPKAASAQFGLGRAYNAAGNKDKAREAFQKALQIDPKCSGAKNALDTLH